MSADARKTMKVSREGVVLIKSFEGFRPRAIRREDGRWVIGYGHTASAREGLSVGEADAELLLQYDLMPVVKALHERLPGGVNQHQFDALASFAFSVGVDQFVGSDVLGRLNAGAPQEAADALIGWPVETPPDAALRRRAAERALFVADPSAPVALAALLAAPLPPPPVVATEPPPEVEAEIVQPSVRSEAPGDARAAALATLLGEAAAAAPEPEVQVEATPEPAADAPAETDIEPAGRSADAADAPASVEEVAAVDPEPVETAEAEDASPSAANDGAPPAPSGAGFQRYMAYGSAMTGALPAAGPTIPAQVPSPTLRMPAEAPPAPEAEPEPAATPDLVLTPPSEDEAAPVFRPAWNDAQRPGQTADQPLFQDEPDQSLGAILRHEVEPEAPRRFDWNETGAFVVMGGIGLVSFGAAMAAFRRASQHSGGGDIAMIGWALAVIAALCVGVSGFYLLQKIGRPKAD